jgi:cbb3-type cytochrome oxidase subunit 3
MTTVACALLLIGSFIYVFWPERHVQAQLAKTRLEYLREQREVLYENLRDLNFEYRAGKYPEEDYAAQRALLENEAAETVAEIDLLESDVLTPYQAPQHG